MITGKKRQSLTKEAILTICTTYDIYRFYMGDFPLNKSFVNKYRGESTPSLIIGDKVTDTLTHKDFGDRSWRGDCFSLVEKIYGCDYPTALGLIDRDMQLGLNAGCPVQKSPVVSWVQPKIISKPPPLIQVVTRKFNKEELSYWGGCYQGVDDLKREHIYVPKEIYINRKRLPKGDMAFCYFCPDIEKWKIYRPLAGKREKTTPAERWKWLSNIPFDYVEGKWNIAGCETAIVTKSRKDSMVLTKALGISCICNTQAEDPACLSDDSIEFIKMNSERQVSVMDSDKKGKEFSWWLTEEHGFLHCNVPESYKEEGIKDFSDLAMRYSLDVVKQHFIKKRIIND